MRIATVCFIIFSLIISTHYCAAQRVPGMKWQKLLGGQSFDDLSQVLVDHDGGYLVAATSSSIDGDVSGNHLDSNGDVTNDIWVAKLDTQRNVIWSTSLGGSGWDALGSFQSLQLAHDSGYIVVGFTDSNDGDVSGNHGSNDVWVVRLGTKGNIVWQKCYGGTNVDLGICIEKTSDGYIIMGSTMSNDGDVSGLHSTILDDIWMAKIDKQGNLLWQKCFGGYGHETPAAIKQTPDGGFIFTGITNSFDGDVQGIHNPSGHYVDIWVVKVDKNGNIEWQKCLGGSNSDWAYGIELTAEGGYMVVGSTLSSDGDVTGYHVTDTTYATYDAWVVNLSSTGALQWQKCFGGSREDEFYDIRMLPDHSFVAVGRSASSNGDISNSYGGNDCMLANFNSSGSIIWEKNFSAQPNGDEYGIALSLTNNGNILIGGVSRKEYDDDVWLFEVGASNTITGYAFYDANSDGVKNNSESFFDQLIIKSIKNDQAISGIPQNGYYKLDADSGSYVTTAIPYKNYYTIVPASKISVFDGFFNTDSVNFAVQPLPDIRDLTINLISMYRARPGGSMQYKLVYKNVGTNTVNAGSIKLVKDSRLSLVAATPSQTSTNNDTLTWNFNNLTPNTEASIIVDMLVGVPPAVNIRDTLRSIAWIDQDATDVTPVDDTIKLKEVVIGSLDPNDKTEANAGIITPAQVTNGEYLNYTIRFQNTGTDTAYNITVRDTLESRLDWSSLQMISSSHPYQLSIENGNKLTWQFTNIKLPYQEPNSHGYIAYRIKPLSTVHAGDTIKNTAGIYFDLNLPVATNINKTIVFLPSSALPVALLSFQAAQAGSIVNVSWKTSAELNAKYFEVQRSDNGIDFTTIGTVPAGNITYLFKDNSPIAGYNYYRLKPVDIDGKFTYSTIVMVNMKSGAEVISSLYPNPGNGNVTLKLQGTVQGNVMVQVLDQQGREVVTKQFGVQHTGEFKTPLDLGKLSKGSYVLRIVVDSKVYLQKLLIQ